MSYLLFVNEETSLVINEQNDGAKNYLVHIIIIVISFFFIQRMFGDLHAADGEAGGMKGKRWKLDWDKAPQPIQIKMKTLRGVRDKLPGE